MFWYKFNTRIRIEYTVYDLKIFLIIIRCSYNIIQIILFTNFIIILNDCILYCLLLTNIETLLHVTIPRI